MVWQFLFNLLIYRVLMTFFSIFVTNISSNFWLRKRSKSLLFASECPALLSSMMILRLIYVYVRVGIASKNSCLLMISMLSSTISTLIFFSIRHFYVNLHLIVLRKSVTSVSVECFVIRAFYSVCFD